MKGRLEQMLATHREEVSQLRAQLDEEKGKMEAQTREFDTIGSAAAKWKQARSLLPRASQKASCLSWQL